MLDITVERTEPERFFAWRWHPYAVDPSHDYARSTSSRGAGTKRSIA